MQTLGIPARFYHTIRSLVFGTTKDQVRIDYPTDAACVLDTRGAYQHLAVEAASKGVDLILNSNVLRATRTAGRVTGVECGGSKTVQRFSSSVVIDASGQAAVVGRDCGIVAPSWSRVGTGVEVEAYVEHLDSAVSYLLVGSGVAPGGYAWVFPTSESTARVGVGVLRPESQSSPKRFLEDLLNSPPECIKDLGRIVPFEEHGGIIPVEEAPRVPVGDGIIVVGDAACQANPVVGEGIRPAMMFGRLAAEVSSRAILSNDCTLPGFRSYVREWQSYLRSHDRALELNRRMAVYDDSRWERALVSMRKLSHAEWYALLRGDLSLAFVLGLAFKHPSLLTSRLGSGGRDNEG